MHELIWIIIDRLTKSSHFLHVRITYNVAKLTKIYISEIVRLHGVPSSIISDRYPKFTTHFWGALHEAFGIKLRLSSLEDLLRACVLDDRGSWYDILSLIEFTCISCT